MIFNTIMVQLDVDSPAAPRSTYALELARRFEATLIGFAAPTHMCLFLATMAAWRRRKSCVNASPSSRIA